MTIKINVPLWMKDVEDEGLLALSWFLRTVHRKYGQGEVGWFQYYITDINTLLGQMVHLETLIEKHNIDPKFLQVGRALDKKIMIKIAETKAVTKVEIKDPRLVIAIVYIKGCLTKSLIEPDDYKPSDTFDKDLRDCVSFRAR